MKKRKFKNYLVNSDLQLRITLKFVIPTLFLSVLSGLIVFLIIWPLVFDFVPEALIERLQTTLIMALFVGSIGIVCLATAFGIIITHRIAGPIYRIEQQLKKLLQEGKFEPIHIRHDDEFQELVDIVNRVIEQYQQKNPER